MSRKEKMIRVGGVCYGDPAWSARQAAQITGIPVRTAQHWGQSGFFRPSIAMLRESLDSDDEGLVYSFPHLMDIELPREGVSWYYGLGDCVGLRVAYDLRQQKVPMEPVQGCARTLADIEADFWRNRYREDPRFKWITYIPEWMWEDAELEPPPFDQALIFHKEKPEDHDIHPDIVIYDIFTAITETLNRADAWLQREGVDPDTRPYWL